MKQSIKLDTDYSTRAAHVLNKSPLPPQSDAGKGPSSMPSEAPVSASPGKRRLRRSGESWMTSAGTGGGATSTGSAVTATPPYAASPS